MAARRFSHWLVRQVGYEAILVAERRTLHRVAAEAVEARAFAGMPGFSDDGLLAGFLSQGDAAERRGPAAAEPGEHWERAGGARRAGLLNLLAAESCRQRCRYDEANRPGG